MIAALLLVVGLAAQDAPLAARAWQAVQERKGPEAERLFAELTRITPGDPRAWVGYAAAALVAGRDADARPRLERALALNPAESEAALLLADVFVRQSRMDDAIRTLERARDAGASAPAIEARLTRLRDERALHSSFRQSNNARFTVLFEGAPEQALADAILERLDRAWDRVSRTLDKVPAGVITVTLYTEQQFVDITRAPAWAAAAYDGRIRLPVRGALSSGAELDRVLTHELAHAFVRAAAPRNVPMWLDEGIASLVEPRDTSWASKEVQRAGRLLPPELLMQPFRSLPDDAARLAYAQSTLFVRAIVDQHSEGALNALLADLGRGVPFEEAFQARIFVRWPAFFARVAMQLGIPYADP